MGIAVGDLQQEVKAWLSSKVRIDAWSLDEANPTPTVINNVLYPPNTGIVDPVRSLTYLENDFGLIAAAEFNFELMYRFPKQLSKDQLPLSLATNVLNNVYFLAVQYPQDIHKDILQLTTPDRGVDVVVGKVSEDDPDWILLLQISLYITFKAALADLSGIQPIPTDPTFNFNKLDIAVYRAEIGDFDTNRLDTTISIEATP